MFEIAQNQRLFIGAGHRHGWQRQPDFDLTAPLSGGALSVEPPILNALTVPRSYQ
jgi:hypothetical protein